MPNTHLVPWRKMVAIVLYLGLFLLRPVVFGQPVIQFRDAPAHCFPDAAVAVPVHIAVPATFQGRLQWEFRVDTVVVARGEQAADFPTPGDFNLSIPLVMPPGRPDVMLAATLQVALTGTDLTSRLTAKHSFWILGRAPWQDRMAWLKQLDILLFDPDHILAPILEEADIPFTVTRNPDAFSSAAGRLLIIAEGLDLRKYRDLEIAMLQAVAAGIPVICLAPISGEFELPGSAGKPPYPSSIRMADRAILRELDTCLDTDCRNFDYQLIASTIRLSGADERVMARIQPEKQGWPWLEITLPAPSARLIFAGFALAKNWDRTPVARHIFLRLLEYVALPSDFKHTQARRELQIMNAELVEGEAAPSHSVDNSITKTQPWRASVPASRSGSRELTANER